MNESIPFPDARLTETSSVIRSALGLNPSVLYIAPHNQTYTISFFHTTHRHQTELLEHAVIIPRASILPAEPQNVTDAFEQYIQLIRGATYLSQHLNIHNTRSDEQIILQSHQTQLRIIEHIHSISEANTIQKRVSRRYETPPLEHINNLLFSGKWGEEHAHGKEIYKACFP